MDDRRRLLAAAAAWPVAAALAACGGGAASGGSGSGTPTGDSAVPPSPSSGGGESLLQRVQADSEFSLLAAALAKAGLDGALADAGAGMTLFAPGNAAFDALAGRLGLGDGAALVDALSAAQWAAILRFHLVPQVLSLATLDVFGQPGGERPATLYSFHGSAAQLIFVDGGDTLNVWDGIGRSSITLPRGDVAASNGVLHVSSDVLLPRGVLPVSQVLRANIDSFRKYAESMSGAFIAELDGLSAATVFVPYDGYYDGGLTDRVLHYHVLPRTLGSTDFPPVPASYDTLLAGDSVGVDATAHVRDSTASPATVTDVDFYASNGVIHVLDRVLVPA